ncbi:CvfB family protein [Helicobacter mesocricetorum]|uniref:CvfB family protein n=1 Tax=Helicobacter mesocricetorum TaxID=87012 RepID=UPI001F30269A|nr:S1-like domain-containing RNA-binding protein [Helicobacter mesocricetorum]
MIEIGTIQKLKICKFSEAGAYLRHYNQEILLPNKYLLDTLKIGDEVEVFLYHDSEDRPIATTLKPKALKGEIAILTITDKNEFGCFLELGIAKDLFMPSPTPQNFVLGAKIAVFIDTDKENRLIAKYNLKPYLKNFKTPNPLKISDKVRIIPFRDTPLGYECLINKTYLGLLYKNEIFENLSLFEEKEAFIKKFYPNGKCDLCLKNPKERANTQKDSQKVLKALEQHQGILPLHYDSPPEEILKFCTMSKKAFKRSLTQLLKEQKILLCPKKSIQLPRKKSL